MRKLLTPKWLALHALAVILIVAFLGLAYWQFKRGEAGNARSLGYALQWPAFALFVVYMWIRMAREELRPPAAEPAEQPSAVTESLLPSSAPPAGAAQQKGDEDDDPELDAELEEYNRWLAELNDHARRAAR